MAFERKNNDLVHTLKMFSSRKKTYFFDLKRNRDNDLYLVINESTPKENEEGYEKHKIFIFGEDLDKFVGLAQEILSHAHKIAPNGLSKSQEFGRFEKKSSATEDSDEEKTDEVSW